MNKPISTVESPCIRKCCLDQKDYCLGCYRHLDEITSWSAYNEQEKREVLEECTKRRAADPFQLSE